MKIDIVSRPELQWQSVSRIIGMSIITEQMISICQFGIIKLTTRYSDKHNCNSYLIWDACGCQDCSVEENVQ